MGDDAREKLAAAISEFYASTTEGGALLTSWYLIASGTGFDSDGSTNSHIVQEWEGGIIEQLGLMSYASSHADQRMYETDDEDDEA